MRVHGSVPQVQVFSLRPKRGFIQAAITSMIRDILCFVPLIIVLPLLTQSVEGILWAAPISDLAAMIVTAILSVSFIKSLHKTEEKEEVETIIKPSKKGVIITIGREHGSSGKQIGKIVAQKLGIPFYYKEMTALAAKESGLDREFIADINTDSPSIFTVFILAPTSFKEQLWHRTR